MKNRDLSFYDTKQYKLTLSICFAVFFYVFMIVFLPFGVDNYDPNHEYDFVFLKEMTYFALPLFVTSLINEFLLRPLIFRKASVQKVILWSLWTLFLMSTLLFFIYNYLGNWHDLRLSSYLEFLLQLPAVLIFPMAGVFFYFQYRSLQDRFEHYELRSPPSYATEERLLTFKGAGSKDQITLSATCFLYGQAQDNYVELYYLEHEQEKKFVMRATLKQLTDSTDHPAITRCHRSYMVNLTKVKTVKGTKQDTTLYLAPNDTAVPVSRSYLKDTLEQLQKMRG